MKKHVYINILSLGPRKSFLPNKQSINSHVEDFLKWGDPQIIRMTRMFLDFPLMETATLPSSKLTVCY